MIGDEYVASGLASRPADVETRDSYEDRVHYYRSMDYSYVPMPANGEYYDTSQGWTRDIHIEQYVKPDDPIRKVYSRLCDYPFLLVNSLGDNRAVIEDGALVGHYAIDGDETMWLYHENMDRAHRNSRPPSPETYDDDLVYDVHSLEEAYPDVAAEIHSEPYESRYGIITLADLNRRYSKEAIYPIVADLANLLSVKIENRYSDSAEILKHLRPGTVGRWYLDQERGLHMHVSEHMNLVEMQQVIRSSDSSFVSECGFSSKSQVGKKLGSINELRNKVMHANRTLVRDRSDLRTMLERLETLEGILSDLRDSTEVRP